MWSQNILIADKLNSITPLQSILISIFNQDMNRLPLS
jgi:hypothetical protein